MIELSINPGPSRKSNVVFWRDPGDRDRLVVQRRLGGCSSVLGFSFLVIAARLERSILTDDPSWGLVALGALLGVAGALVLFARTRLVFDRRGHTLETQLAMVGKLARSTRSIEAATALRVDEVVSGGGSDESSMSTSYRLRLELPVKQTLDVASAGTWEAIVPVAEGVSTFLRLPLYDYVADTLREPDELDMPIVEREKRRQKHAPDAPRASKIEIAIGGGVVRLTYPPPDARVIYLMAVLVSIFWTLPVFLSGGVLFSLFPLAVLAGSWFYVRFGLRSSVEIEDSTLTIVKHGILVDRLHAFSSAELEDIALLSPEWGGHRNIVAHMTEGYLVARSDTQHARFGWGLSKKELEWLRAYILAAIEPPKVPTPKRVPEDDLPVGSPSWLAPLIGLGIGAVAARLFGGRLELCLAVPFLEHVINVGGLIGLLIAVYIADRAGSEGKATRPLVWTCLALLAGAVFYRAHPLLQPFPTFDEKMLAAMKTPPTSFWVGWTAAALLPNTAVAALVLLAASLRPKRVTREDAPKPKKKPFDPVRQERNSRIALFIAGVPFLLGGVFATFHAVFRGGEGRWPELLAGLFFLLPGLAMMQAWRLIPRRYWPKNVEWDAMIGVLAACGVGSFIIAISILGDKSQMNAPRAVVAAAGSVFFFAGVAILPQALPRLAGHIEWVSRIAVALLLSGFAVVAFWPVMHGAPVFIIGLLLTGGLALASWWSLVREVWSRVKGRRSQKR